MLLESIVALALVGQAAAPSFAGPAPEPTTVAQSFVATVRTPFVRGTLSWRSPELAALVPTTPGIGIAVENGGLRSDGQVDESDGVVTRNRFPAEPDGFGIADELPEAGYVLGRVRGGKARLVADTVGGKPALRTSFRLAGNECAALRPGTATMWLDAETLLPVRYLEVRGAKKQRREWRMTYTSVNQEIPLATFDQPRLGRDPFRSNFGFVRETPQAAATKLSYTPLLPADVPDGFSLEVSGWAPRSAITGPEGSNPEYPQLFAAVYRRGWERVDVTQRLGKGEDWPTDPFGGECSFELVEKASVNGKPALYGTRPGVQPHLWWRDGKLLLTVSGPFPKGVLVRIAESLAPVPLASA